MRQVLRALNETFFEVLIINEVGQLKLKLTRIAMSKIVIFHHINYETPKSGFLDPFFPSLVLRDLNPAPYMWFTLLK